MEFERRIIGLIKAIPRGKVATYGQIAALAGNHRAARQVARILHSSSQKHRLPWHRIVNRQGGISLRSGRGFEEQIKRLKSEGVKFGRGNKVNLEDCLWETASRRFRDFEREWKRSLGSSKRAARRDRPPLDSG